MNCKFCGQELLQMNGNSNYYVYVCDDWHCHIFRQPQAYRARNPDALPELIPRYRSRRGFTYEDFKVQKRENYQVLRNLGIAPKAANLKSSSNKQTQLALEMSINE